MCVRARTCEFGRGQKGRNAFHHATKKNGSFMDGFQAIITHDVAARKMTHEADLFAQDLAQDSAPPRVQKKAEGEETVL